LQSYCAKNGAIFMVHSVVCAECSAELAISSKAMVETSRDAVLKSAKVYRIFKRYFEIFISVKNNSTVDILKTLFATSHVRIAQIPLGSTRHDSTRSTCRAHVFWLCRNCRTAQLDSLDTSSSTGSTGSTRRERFAT